jgi:hypothetical protein
MVFNAIFNNIYLERVDSTVQWGRRGLDRMVVGFTTTYAISADRH